MKICSLILARGGSKGILNKNIVPIAGKPLLWHVINASHKSCVHETWVSTDSPDIKSVAIESGARVIDRPANISGDNAKSDAALMHFANNIDFDILVFIQPTSPLLYSEDIDKGLAKMGMYDSVFSVYKEHWIPQWSLTGSPIDWDVNNRPMRQDMPETYVENGAFYITTKTALLQSELRYSGNIGTVEMPKSRSFQIDTEDDLLIVENMLLLYGESASHIS